MAELVELLQYLIEAGGADLHLKSGAPPHIRIGGQLQAAPFGALDPAAVEALAFTVLPSPRAEEFAATGEADFAHSVSGLGRFRVNVYRQRGSVAMVAHHVVPSSALGTHWPWPPSPRSSGSRCSKRAWARGSDRFCQVRGRDLLRAVRDRIVCRRPAHGRPNNRRHPEKDGTHS